MYMDQFLIRCLIDNKHFQIIEKVIPWKRPLNYLKVPCTLRGVSRMMCSWFIWFLNNVNIKKLPRKFQSFNMPF